MKKYNSPKIEKIRKLLASYYSNDENPGYSGNLSGGQESNRCNGSLTSLPSLAIPFLWSVM